MTRKQAKQDLNQKLSLDVLNINKYVDGIFDELEHELKREIRENMVSFNPNVLNIIYTSIHKILGDFE